jgi:hypothetical protein
MPGNTSFIKPDIKASYIVSIKLYILHNLWTSWWSDNFHTLITIITSTFRRGNSMQSLAVACLSYRLRTGNAPSFSLDMHGVELKSASKFNTSWTTPIRGIEAGRQYERRSSYLSIVWRDDSDVLRSHTCRNVSESSGACLKAERLRRHCEMSLWTFLVPRCVLRVRLCEDFRTR